MSVLEPGEHPQRGRLAATGGADEHEELAVCDVDAEVVDRDRVVEALRDVLERDPAIRGFRARRQHEMGGGEEGIGDGERQERHQRGGEHRRG